MLKKIMSVFLSTAIICLFSANNAVEATSNHNRIPIEILSLRTENGKYFDNGDGTITGYISTASLHYYDNNEWKNIDNSLVMDEYGNLCNKSNATKLTIPSVLNLSDISTKKDNSFTIEHDNYSLSVDLIDSNFLSAETKDTYISAQVFNETNDCQEDDIAKIVNKDCNLTSRVSYDFPNCNYDLTLSVNSNSLVESLEIASPPASTHFAFHIASNNLTAIEGDNNSIQFLDNDKDVVAFSIPQIYLEDSSNKLNHKEVSTILTETDDGYILSLSLDKTWLDSNANYPVRLISEVTSYVDPSTFYISSANTTTSYQDSYLVFGGGISGTANYESVIYKPILIPNSSEMTAVKKAEFCVYLLTNNNSGTNKDIEACTLNNNFTYPQWISCGTGKINSTSVSETTVPENAYGYTYFDITKAVQSDLNYVRSGSYVGSYSYGFKLRARNSRLFYGFSERYSYLAPYFKITYVTNSNYEMAHTPEKYNNIGSGSSSDPMYNFQGRMNCYAYALQVYYRSYTPSDSYKLLPGEFGIQQTASSEYPVSNFGDLNGHYNTLYNDIMNDEDDNERQSTSKDYMNFIEEQMSKDAAALSFSLTPLDTYTSPYYIVDNDFNLPSDFNPNNERIIAFVTYLSCSWNPWDVRYDYNFDYHYYLRNGNGTCTNPSHDSNCSKWTHKPGTSYVIDRCATDSSVYLCDDNIGNYACSVSNLYYTNNEVRYYRITKNTNIYNSWHGYGHDTTSTGTPYQP